MEKLFHEARPGELRMSAPGRFDAQISFIGRIRTPWTERAACPKNSREAIARGAAAEAMVELDPLYRDGLRGLDGASHVWLLYWMDRAPRDLIVQAPKHLDAPRGVFALRSPARPNPIAMTAVQLLSIDGPRLRVLGVDCLDGTPLIDLKPYFPSTDAYPDATPPQR